MTARARVDAVTDHLRTPLYRDAYALIVAYGITSVIGLAYWALAARLFTPDDLGAASALISILVFLSAISQLNLRVALLRFVPEAGGRTRRFVLLCYGAIALAGLAIGLGFIATMRIWIGDSPVVEALAQPEVAILFLVSVVVWSYFNIQDGLLTGLGRAVLVPFENGLYSIAKLVLLIALAPFAAQTAVFVSWTLPAAVLVIAITAFVLRTLIPSHVRQSGERTFDIAPSLLLGFLTLDYVASLFSSVTLTLMPAIVVAMLGTTNGAYFYMPWLIVTTLTLVPQYTVASFTVQTVRHHGDLANHVWRTLVHMLRIVIPVAVILFVLAPLILRLFGADYADNGTTTLRLGALALVPLTINVLFLGVARVQRRGKAIVAVQATITILTLGASIVLMPTEGLASVTAAWLGAQTLVAVYVLLRELRPLVAARSRRPT